MHTSAEMDPSSSTENQGLHSPSNGQNQMSALLTDEKKETNVQPLSDSSLFDLPPVSDTNPQLPRAKRRRVSREDGFSAQESLEKPQLKLYQKQAVKDGIEGASQSTSRLSRDLESDTNRNTPNDSATSASLISPFPQEKSASPSMALIASLKSTLSRPKLTTTASSDYEKYKPRSSIPAGVPAPVYAQQCVAAAYASRLNPYALHKDEQVALQDHLCHLHVTVYLNIRNGILRLWTRNPMVSVTKEEALGCAKDLRWMNLAAFAYDWLVRNGYINFGCVEIPKMIIPPKRGRRKEGPVIVVVGAGMSGLACARQLEGLFNHYHDKPTLPRVIVLEGRCRIGGRIYSHPLKSHQTTSLPAGLRPTAEMGAQIIVGFEHGNPLDPIIRAQLAIRYHLLRDLSTIYDVDGSAVDEVQDVMDERLYIDVLDRSGSYRHKTVINSTAEGDRRLIDYGRDLSTDDGVTVRQYEEARVAGTVGLLLPATRLRRGIGHKTAHIGPSSAPQLPNPGSVEERPAALECQNMGWKLRTGVSLQDTINLDHIARASPTQTLGAVMDEGVKQYQRMLPLTAKDMRLLNWHFANLEYANAANVGKLSLSEWDQDMGNEFDGEHGQVIGGYQQVPRGLWSFPNKLDVRRNKIVTKIVYKASTASKGKTMVHCEDGEAFAADHVVFTGSLGTLKHRTVEFVPPLPDWKTGAIDRLGFGVMNKVVLVFDKPFWDVDRDMFGLLREPENPDSMIQEEYSTNRGRFYLFWNCIKTSGLPVLIALMAGDAAHQAETMKDADILAEVVSQLRNIFKNVAVPDPLETIITRWESDRFTRGSYSYVASEALPGDYDLVAKSVGNLHFAGEATCGTHPATVHGAYLSGLRAAAEIMDTILGPIVVPTPLVPRKADNAPSSSPTVSPGKKRKVPPPASFNLPVAITPAVSAPSKNNNNPIPTTQAQPSDPSSSSSETALRDAYDQAMLAAIHAELGQPEPRPAKIALNPFLFFQKDYWQRARERCEEAKRTATNDPTAKAARDEIRQALGKMWREAGEDIKRPYQDQMAVNRQTNTETLNRWKERMEEYERKTSEAKERWMAANPFEKWRAEKHQDQSNAK
jgi:monoamine oxidase